MSDHKIVQERKTEMTPIGTNIVGKFNPKQAKVNISVKLDRQRHLSNTSCGVGEGHGGMQRMGASGNLKRHPYLWWNKRDRIGATKPGPLLPIEYASGR